MSRINLKGIRNYNTHKNESISSINCSLFGFLFIVALIITIIFSLLQLKNYNDFANSKTLNDEVEKFEIKQGESLTNIMSNLTKQGIILDKKVFFLPAYSLFLQFEKHDTSKVQAGVFQIPPNTPIKDIFSYFSPKECDQIRITFKEGKRVEEYGEIIQKALQDKENVNFSYEEFLSLARNYSPSEDMNLSFQPPKNVEGYLFPDTYDFCVESSSKTFLDKLIANFDTKVFVKLNSEINSKNQTLEKVINIASMIEREAYNPEERRMIAGIINNRLSKGITLGIDATSQYSIGYSTIENTWWPKGAELSNQLNKNEPYNTRLNLGLPPTPISNPGLDSIKAVLEPKQSDYYYYLHDQNGKIYYARTLDEHNRNVCKYLNKTC